MNHRPYELAGSLSAKVKGFMGLPRSLNVVMRKYEAAIRSESCPTATTRLRSDSIRQSGRNWRMFSFSGKNLTRGSTWIDCFQESDYDSKKKQRAESF